MSNNKENPLRHPSREIADRSRAVQIAEILRGQDLSILQNVLKELGVGVVTPNTLAMQNKLLCDPIIWIEEDLESVTLDQWNGTRAYRSLSERSIEEGHEIKQALESMCEY